MGVTRRVLQCSRLTASGRPARYRLNSGLLTDPGGVQANVCDEPSGHDVGYSKRNGQHESHHPDPIHVATQGCVFGSEGGGTSHLVTSAQDRMSTLVGSCEFTTETGVTSGATGSLERRAPDLFLDYDNVLHPCDAFRMRHGIRPADPDATLFQLAPLLGEMRSPYPVGAQHADY